MILRRVALVDQNKIGLSISVFVSVEFGSLEAWLKNFASAVAPCPGDGNSTGWPATSITYCAVLSPTWRAMTCSTKLISAVPLKNVTSRFAMGRSSRCLHCRCPRRKLRNTTERVLHGTLALRP